MTKDEIRRREARIEAAKGKQARFLAAWQEGVRLAGKRYFRITAPSVEQATDIDQLRPNDEEIEDAIGVISSGEAVFLAAMVSFFNAELGQGLLQKCGYPNISDLASKLDEPRARVIAELFVNYHGW